MTRILSNYVDIKNKIVREKWRGAVKNLFVFTLTSTGAVVTVTVGAERGRGFGSCL